MATTVTMEGQHALVTGGGTGIGAAIARRLALSGARVTIAGRRREFLDAVAESLGAGHGTIVADVTDEESVRAMFRDASQARGVVTILVNNAGAASSAPTHKETLEHWNGLIGVNLTGAFLCSREFLIQLPREAPARIINVASTAGLKGYPYVAAYCAAKHGVIGFTRSLALELSRRPVTVNAICPGYTQTPLLEAAISNVVDTTGRAPDHAARDLLRSNPQGRFIQPQEVAEAVHWLCLPESASVTGTTVSLAGGEI